MDVDLTDDSIVLDVNVLLMKYPLSTKQVKKPQMLSDIPHFNPDTDVAYIHAAWNIWSQHYN